MPKGLQQIPFAISSGKSYSSKNNNSELLNLFVHIDDQGSKNNHILINTCGLEFIGEVAHTIFGVYEFLGVVYIASEKALYKYNEADNTFTDLGVIAFSRKVSISDNGTSLMMVAENGYSYTPSTGVIKDMSTESGWFSADTVSYMDGYFIFNRTLTGQFFISKLYSTEIDPIDWATAESAPDDTVGIIVSTRQLWILGERTIEVWYDSGDPAFPFTRISGAVSDIGCASHQTISKIRDSIYFVGNDFKVYATNGYTPVIVSTPAIEFFLFRADRVTLNAFTYTEEGHWFYVLTIDNEKTFVYDPDTAQWHSRKSISTKKWKIDGAINIYSSASVVGYSEKEFHSLSIDTYTENGDSIKREAITLPINKSVNRIRINEVQLDMEVGLSTEAKVILELSKDAGKTWGNDNLSSTGKKGDHLKKVRWLRLGQARDAIIKIVITDAIPIRILGLWIRVN